MLHPYSSSRLSRAASQSASTQPACHTPYPLCKHGRWLPRGTAWLSARLSDVMMFQTWLASGTRPSALQAAPALQRSATSAVPSISSAPWCTASSLSAVFYWVGLWPRLSNSGLRLQSLAYGPGDRARAMEVMQEQEQDGLEYPWCARRAEGPPQAAHSGQGGDRLQTCANGCSSYSARRTALLSLCYAFESAVCVELHIATCLPCRRSHPS